MEEQFYRVKIVKIKEESFDSKSFYLDIPGELSEEFKFKQGQHIYLRLKVDGTEYFRPYSISSAPKEKDFTFTVKRLRGGVVSNYLNDSLKEGDEIDVMPPKGDFYSEINNDNNSQYYFLGAGSGIAPLMSLIKVVLAEETASVVNLFFGNRNEDSIIFHKELIDLQKKYTGRFNLELILSAPKKYRKPGLMGFLSSGEVKWEGKIGHIDNKTLEGFFDHYPIIDKDKMQVFVCGPDGMISSSEKFLLKKGVEKRNILTESFNRDYANLLPGGKIDACNVKIKYKGEDYNVVIDDRRPILDNLLKEDVIIPFACRSGLCSACVAQVTKGEVNTRKTKGLDPAFQELGFILSCQSTPKTTELELNYDTFRPSN